MQKQIRKTLLSLALCALCAAGASQFITRPVAGQAQTLHGTAALKQLKQDGQFDSLQAAMQQARLSVKREGNTPLGRWAWHAPNAAAGYDAYVTEAGVSIALNEQTYVSLHLRSLGYGSLARRSHRRSQRRSTIHHDQTRQRNGMVHQRRGWFGTRLHVA